MIKNILNYTKNLICFAVSSLLLLSISYATEYDYIQGSANETTSTSIAGYTVTNSAFDSVVRNSVDSGTISSDYQTIINDILSATNTTNYVGYKNADGYYHCYFYNPSEIQIIRITNPTESGYTDFIKMYYINTNVSYYDLYLYNSSSVSWANKFYTYTVSSVGYRNINASSYWYNIYGNGYIEDYTISANKIYSTGNYFYGSSPTPSYIPTNEEIAEKVQAFYDSDLFQNQNDFKDYFVLYNYQSEIFSFIGHNLSDDIGQLVYRADFPQNTTGVDYWRFYLVDASTHVWNWFNNYYWLYATTLDSDTITYTGKGAVTDLLELKFDPTYSTIVYSTTDYPCQIYGWDDTNHEITVESETISGDSYTYDENIDPTTSEYNPITNYVLPNSIDTLLSNADTSSLFDLFVVPDFSNMEWVLLAVGVFWGYFGGFVLLTCVLLFIYWVLRGV